MFRQTPQDLTLPPAKGEDGRTPLYLAMIFIYCFLLGSGVRLSAYDLYIQVKSSDVHPQSKYVMVPNTRAPEC